MKALRRGWKRLIGTFAGKAREREMSEEFAAHVAMQTEDNVRAGMDPKTAAREAKIKFGSPSGARDGYRYQRGLPVVETFVQDLRHGCRTLLKARGFTFFAVLTLALGIGANTTIFSAVEAIVLRPLPYTAADRLVAVYLDGPEGLRPSPETYAAVRERTRMIEDLAAWSGWSFTLTGEGEAEVVVGARVTPSLFEVLGAAPLHGRTLLDADSQPWSGSSGAGGSAAILSEAFWRRRYGGDPSVIGRTITIDGMGVPIVGVMPRSFAFPSPATELWLPVAIPSTIPVAGGFLRVMGRLGEGATSESATAELRAITRQLTVEYPDQFPDRYGTGAALVPLGEDLTGSTRGGLLVLFGAVGAVLLIASANLTNLFLARASSRTSETSIRAALGAGRARIVRQVLTEHMVLVGLGALVGLALAHQGVRLLGQTLPPITGGTDLGMNPRVLAFALVLSILVGLLSGIAPALRTARGDLQKSLRKAGRGSRIDHDRRRLLDSLVIGEVAVALILLVGAGLMLQSFWRLSQQDPGFRAENVLTFRATVPPSGQPGQFTATLLERLAALPGARSVGALHLLPLGGSNWLNALHVEGRPLPAGTEGPMVDWRVATPGYFRTIGVPLLAGRDFSEDDRADTLPVALVGETLARDLFPGEDPIGQRVRTLFEGEEWATIVGVVGDTKDVELGGAFRPQIYRPFRQYSNGRMTYMIRSDGDPTALARAAGEVVAEVSPNVPVDEVQSLEAVLARSIAQPRLLMALLSAFGAVALLMATLGIYGVISYAVGQRTREFGIRMALGARPADLSRDVIRGGARLSLIGLLIGFGGAWGLSRLLQSELYETEARDPGTFAVMAILLAGVALAGAYLPARRAARVDPMASLGEE